MKKNMGPLDRLVRLLLGNLLIVLVLFGVIESSYALYLVLGGAALLLTSFFGFCPLYAAFVIDEGKISK